MKVTIDVKQPSGDLIKSFELDAEPNDSVGRLIDKTSEAIGIGSEEILENLGVGETLFKREDTVSECIHHGIRWHMRLVCIELHFEGEPSTKQWFNPRQKWQAVHRWGCRHFGVAADACPNLELRMDFPDGGLLNDSRPIGDLKGCKTVWLISPGPEANG